jgi:mRNA-degrading endonuclease RelE of RelBE toxin-antitoxin system
LEVKYRKLFLKDLKKLKSYQVHYDRVYEIAFEILPKAENLREIKNLKPMKGYPKRYRIWVGDFRIGLEVQDKKVEMMRVLHRKEFYRYFP